MFISYFCTYDLCLTAYQAVDPMQGTGMTDHQIAKLGLCFPSPKGFSPKGFALERIKLLVKSIHSRNRWIYFLPTGNWQGNYDWAYKYVISWNVIMELWYTNTHWVFKLHLKEERMTSKHVTVTNRKIDADYAGETLATSSNFILVTVIQKRKH